MSQPVRWAPSILLIIGLLQGDSSPNILPFDWSGQNGLLSVNGQLFWNHDWMSGPLYFDGTFSNFPLRFGPSYLHSFQPDKAGEVPKMESIPDSAQISSSFDYRKGDYLFDQLDVQAGFSDGTRLLKMNGFKRSYAGSFGQYVQPEGILTPNQQSYRLDYLASFDTEKVQASVAHFVTNSGLPDSIMNGHHENITTVAGISYSKTDTTKTFQVFGSQFNQERRVELSSIFTYLNRTHLHFRWTWNAYKTVGFFADKQSIMQDELRDLKWVTIYGGLNGERLTTSLGGSFLSEGKSYAIYLKSSFSLQGKSWEINTGLSYNTKPAHIALIDTSQMFETWSRVHLNIEKRICLFRFQSANNFGSVAHSGSGSNPNYLSSELSMSWEIYSKWTVSGMVGMYETLWNNSSLVENTPLTDGFRRKIQFSIKGSQPFFHGNMMVHTKLRVNGNLNREQNYGYDFVNAIPIQEENQSYPLPDYWVAHFEISAVVSKMTLIWKVQNVLNAYEPTAREIYPGLNNDYVWIRNNRDFYPMGQLISFSVLWNFEN